MKNKIIYKVITSRNFKKYEEEILKFIDKDNKRPDQISKSLKNSNYIIIAILDEKVI
jgi:predicted DNA-binding ArsR family transcriptional regulator